MSHQARKRFGQNFLHDLTVIDNILAHAQPVAGQHWLEIGPGQGALTEPLLQTGVKLDIVELDRDLVALLSKKFAGHSNLTLHSGDALAFDFAGLAQPAERLRIIGNLPYNISTPLMFHLLDNAHCVADMHFMLQKEVVDRICAEPGSKQYGRLSVMMQYYCQTEWLFDVPPESFDPIPKVMSAIVKLTPHAEAPVTIADFALFQELVTHAFSQRRKTLRNALQRFLSDQAFAELGIDSRLRPEAVSLEEFAALSNRATRLDR